jgi:uncharacterized protein (UPF0335 family)
MSRRWLQPDGTPISCREKLEILDENHEELRHVMQDAFEDALLMGVDESLMRQTIAELVAKLQSPKQR